MRQLNYHYQYQKNHLPRENKSRKTLMISILLITFFLGISFSLIRLSSRLFSQVRTTFGGNLYLVAAPADSNYLYQSSNQNFKVYLGNRQQTSQAQVKLEKQDGAIEFSSAQLSEEEAQLIEEGKQAVVYKNVQPGIDLRYSLTEKGIKEEIIISNQQNAISKKQFAFNLNLTGLNFKQEGNLWYFYKNDVPLFYIPQPFMTDAQGNRSEAVEIRLETKGGTETLVIEPDSQWLAEPNRVFPVVIDPTIEIVILNVHSHPQAGDNWEVSFETLGMADLTITPDDQATIDDLDFVSLTCNGQTRNPQILTNDVIFYPNWSCEGEGKISHYVKRAGKHTLKFLFGEQTAYAYNNPGWWDSSWSYRFKYTITNSGVGETLTDFPLHIDLTNDAPASFWTHVSFEDGRDIRVVDEDDTTDLTGQAHLESFSKAGYQGHLWVKRTIAASGNSEYVWIYYGNGSATASWNKSATYTNFNMVQHMEETSGTIDDETSNNNDFTNDGAATYSSGEIGSGLEFVASETDYLSLADVSQTGLELNGDYTLNLWVNFIDDSAGNQPFLFKGDSSYSDYYGIGWYYPVDNFYLVAWHRASWNDDYESSSFNPSDTEDGNWYMMTVIFDDSEDDVIFCLDGVCDAADTLDKTSAGNSAPVLIGGDAGSGYYVDARLDEMRVSSVPRPTEWVEFAYLSDKGDAGNAGSEESEGEEPAEWWDSDWSYRFRYEINNSKVGETLTDFPLHIDLTNDAPAAFWTHVDSDGDDIRIIDENGSTELSSQAHLEGWDYNNEKGHIWVKRTITTSGNPEYVWIYYGNSGASNPFSATTKENTYNTGYSSVWHMDESSGARVDSTTNDNDLTDNNTVGSSTSGEIGTAADFENSSSENEYLSITDAAQTDLEFNGDYTVNFWINLETYEGSGEGTGIIAKGMWDWPGFGMLWDYLTDTWYLVVWHTNSIGTNEEEHSSFSNWSGVGAGIWYMMTVTYDDSTDQIIFCKNGVCDSADTLTVDNSGNSDDVLVGGYIAGDRYLDGKLDEIRVSNTPRSAEWIEFTYLSDKGDGGNAGSEESENEVDTSTSSSATAYAFQRKTWYDGERYWTAFHSDADNRIEFWYSADGSSWTENSTAQILVDTNDFTIEADSSNAFIVYTNGYDIEGKEALSYPTTGFSWGSTVTVLNGSGSTNEYDYPVITKDSSDYVWVAARYTGSGVYYMKAIKEGGGTDDLPEDSGDTVYSISDTSNSNSNAYGTIVPLTTQDVYAAWIKNTAIEGRVWDNSGSQWEDSTGGTTYPDGIDTGATGMSNNLSAVSDSSGNVHLAYIDSSNKTKYKEYQLPSRGYDAPVFATSFDGADSNLCDGGDGWDSGYCAGTNQAVGNETTTVYSPIYGAKFDLNGSGASAATTKWLASAYETIYYRFNFRIGAENLANDEYVVLFSSYDVTDYDKNDIILHQDSGGNLELGVNDVNAVSTWAGSDGYVSVGTWYTLEWKIYRHPTSGTMDLWLDGTNILSATNQDTGDYDKRALDLGLMYISNNRTFTMYCDNLVVDTSQIGAYPWETATTLDSNSGNAYTTISLDTATTDLYAIWIRGDDIYYSTDSPPYTSWSSPTSWQTSGTNKWVTSNYSGNGMIFAEWTAGSSSPYSIKWDSILAPSEEAGHFRFEGVKMEGVKID